MTAFPLRSASCVALAISLTACSSINETFSGDKVDYRGSVTRKSALDIPPDLTQLSADTRYQLPAGSVVSASGFQAPVTASGLGATTRSIAPSSVGEVRIERSGNQRWLLTPYTPEQLWPKLEHFWEERHLALVANKPEVGVMETDWAENRARLPNSLIRSMLGKVLDVLSSTGELDKFKLRVERTGTGTEIYLTHRGLVENYAGPTQESTVWQPRGRDAQLEAEILSLLMIKLGAQEDEAKAAVQAAASATPARARASAAEAGAALQLDDSFDRAWRKVGIALDRSGFTVEDRDRGQGLYFVRYVEPAHSGKEEPGFFSKLFGKKAQTPLVRYRVSVKSVGDLSTISVLDADGRPETGPGGQRIVNSLLEELK